MYEKPAIVAVTRTGAYHERGEVETEESREEEKTRASEKYGSYGERISARKGERKKLERIERDTRRERWTEKRGKGTFFHTWGTSLIDNVSFEINGA